MEDTENLSGSSITTSAVPPRRIYGKRYIVHELLGQGAFGQVYRCTDRFGRLNNIALKIAMNTEGRFPEVDSHSSVLLENEADVLETLTGYGVENIPHFHDYTGDALVMDYVGGFSLAHMMKSPAVKPSIIALRASYMLGPSRSVTSALAHDIIHRDIKPQNTKVQGGEGYLLDWGIASPTTSSNEPKREGSWDYMAPEVVDRREAHSAASEVWSLGATTYSILFCRPPRGVRPKGLSEAETIKRLREAHIHEPCKVNPQFPKDLSDLLMAALSKYPSFRPEPDEFRTELEACVNKFSETKTQ